MFAVNNKIILITGGAKGIGAAMVKEFLQRGAKHVTFLDVDKKSGMELEEQMGKYHDKNKVKFIECDVTNDEQLFGAYKSVIVSNGRVDLVVNNAGIAKESLKTYKKLININYTAVVSSTLNALENMRTDRGGLGGTIINISSLTAIYQMSPSYFIYAGSKSAVLQFTNGLGMQDYYKQTGVRMIAVCFGVTKTGILDEMETFDPLVQQKLSNISNIFHLQSVESAARGVIETFEMGNSGDTWVVTHDRPALNITDRVKKAYEIMSEGFQLD